MGIVLYLIELYFPSFSELFYNLFLVLSITFYYKLV